MNANPAVQYLTDENGERTAALIPIEIWKEYERIIDQYVALEESIRRGMQDMRDIKSGIKTAQPVEDFLNEL